MGITEWVAVLVIFAVVYCLIKRYETRLVLIGSGLLLCLISWNLVGGLNAFAKSMTNAIAGDGHLRLDGLCFRC